ncbi:protein SHQ1 homolog [Ornithodoros turicata]|uniref:protein SHQ1 homolog n=1 Tax=Ornithodoros turicata TaxID=34597 RepID=UPI003139EBA8
MLTPAFNLRQDENFLVIEIKAPYTKISDAEIFFEEDDFRFFSSPYYLRLLLPGKVVENGTEAAKYEADTGTFVVSMAKQQPGEMFEGLDLLTKLLAPRRSTKPPTIQVLDDEPLDCQIEQVPWTAQDEEDLKLGGRHYGFARQSTGVIARLKESIPELVDICDPEHKSLKEAREERERVENKHFNEEHYLSQDKTKAKCMQWADLYDGDTIESLLCEPTTTKSAQFSEEEKTRMCRLPRREYILFVFKILWILFHLGFLDGITHLLKEKMQQTLLLGLADILFAYAYDLRITQGEHCVESAWTISKLSATLSWFEVRFESAESVVQSSIRRSLCYPLYRSWKLAQKVLSDVIVFLRRGTCSVVQCLLDVHAIFEQHDSCYVLNQLYMDDYASWSQHLRTETLEGLAQELSEVNLSKSSLNLDLEELEAGADAALTEQASELADAVVTLHLDSDDSE